MGNRSALVRGILVKTNLEKVVSHLSQGKRSAGGCGGGKPAIGFCGTRVGYGSLGDRVCVSGGCFANSALVCWLRNSGME
jgi:hypothetical protein